ncbi:flagellar hook-associated protein FlgL [Peribacillus huizhouensis]|uniref:Flagellar hook-associated protein 3 FlgL n=1 Tax=Peribacillus huizhouensis TaxID=1501239 RepID=A0ABR6CNZ4_9BACI|nr:flagellar hook-associated protein FlgL [Peribacillus huizhouensis]MBA9026725.1 flagellar hook-associated protein 3 FlgL [Peribacillus huizhouensis]
MRVTQSMLSNNMLRNLSSSYDRLGKLQEQISSQKKFTKPSDDPVSAMMGMTYRTDLGRIEQFTRNIGEAENWIDSTDDALDQATSALQRIRELTVKASNGTYEEKQRESIAAEIKELKDHLITIGDTQIGGKYIFNGQNTNIKPSESEATKNDPINNPNGDIVYGSAAIEIEVFSGINIQINTDASSTFGEALKSDGSIQKIIDALENNDSNIGDLLDDIDGTIDSFLTTRSHVGARQNRIELMTERLGQQEIFAKKIMSKNEDIDIEKAIMDLTTQESIHSAALSVGSRVIQPSLIDFLR